MESLTVPRILPLEYPPPIPAPHPRTGTTLMKTRLMAVCTARGGTRKARILELATGIRKRRGDTWVTSTPPLSLLPDGTGATGEDLPFSLRLPADLYNEAIVVVTPGGERTVSRPAGFIYARGTKQ